MAVRFKAHIHAFDTEYPIIKGQRANLHIGLAKISCTIVKIEGLRFIKNGDYAAVEVLCERKFCMENFKNFPFYGRITLREKSNTIAAGIITEIIE